MNDEELESERSLTILYGSQTGTAEEIAERIGREGKRRHFKCKVFAMDEFDIAKLLHEDLVIFVASTTGQGDPPDNMLKFWRFLLRKNLPTSSLQNLKIAVLGLGDSSYIKFNFIAKKIFRRLIQLGANPITKPGYADDQHDLGIDGVIDPWLKNLWDEILRLYPLPAGKEILPSDIRPSSRFKVEISQTNGYQPVRDRCPNELGQKLGRKSWSKDRPFQARIIKNQRMTASHHWQDVRLIKFDITGSEISYSPGDVVMIQPENIEKVVEEFISLLKLNPEETVIISKNDPDCSIPNLLKDPITIHDLVKKYFDIQAVPKRYFFELLSFFTTSEMEQERLLEFASAEGQEELYSYCYRSKRNYFEVLQDFPVAASSVPMEYLLDLIPSMKPRAFSIASAQIAHQNEIHILMAVVKYKTNMHRPRLGVCSNWLASLVEDNAGNLRIPIWISKGTVTLPKNPETPIIMVGPGTGVAPFRAFIEYRVEQGAKGNVLFFGSRNKDKDFFFEEEWSSLSSTSHLDVFTAFSRDQQKKIYVQHILKEQAELIWNIMHSQNGYFYIAGNSKDMPTAVMNCLKEIIKEKGKLTDDDTELYFKKLDATRHLQCETWS
eukprot:Seg4510.1 transcript_id=Seg4510.1/GoldUCD/mRNA.D3Y31 product="NADPH-dependent diflavin oxidoreductase 1" protein_id=Seg4510.1/GoldUCD/D3Y31